MTAVEEPEVESRRHTLIRRILTTIVIFGCLALLVVAAQHTRVNPEDENATVSGTQGEDPAVDLLAPPRESSALNQAQILIDLKLGYDATLTVQGVAIPDAQLQKTPATGAITFTPGPGKVLEKLPQGRVCASGTVFRIDGTVEDPRTVTWCFNVT